MNSLILSQEQKEKLLEMCNRLFTKYNFEVVNWSGGDHRDDVLYLRIENGDIPTQDIHWFEFCILWIFPKLLNFYDSDKLSDFYYIIIGYKFKSEGNNAWNFERFKHPVDYLYEKFKKLQ